MARPFMTARWSNLALANYAVPPSLVIERCPPGCEPDLWRGDAYVSLVAFDFEKLRVRGLPWPGFPEVNLRFYVRCGDLRGVVFIKELVPSRVVAGAARLLYGEPYERCPMNSSVHEAGDAITATRSWTLRGSENHIRMTGKRPAEVVDTSSEAHFFKEHQWGFGCSRDGRRLQYEVRHPEWRVFPVTGHSIDVQWGPNYGAAFAPLQDRAPNSAFFAEGSAIEVYPPVDR